MFIEVGEKRGGGGRGGEEGERGQEGEGEGASEKKSVVLFSFLLTHIENKGRQAQTVWLH